MSLSAKFKILLLGIGGVITANLWSAVTIPVRVEFDQTSANGKIIYTVPTHMPDPVLVKCEFMIKSGVWNNAQINKYRSVTAITLLAQKNADILAQEQATGKVLEYMATGRERTMIWSTAQQLPAGVITKGQVKLELFSENNPQTALACGTADFTADFTNVVMLNKFAANPDIHPPIVANDKRNNPGWFQTVNGLEAFEKEDVIEPIVWRHNLSGYYAIYLQVPKKGYGEIELRLTDDDFAQRFSGFDGYEYFWKMAKLNDTHLVIQQPYRTLYKVGDQLIARLRYVKLVKVSEDEYKQYALNQTEKRDKIVAGYFEPYSWAFREFVPSNTKFFEALAAYKFAGVDIVDAQAGRGGARPLFPTNLEEPLLGETKGDAAPGSNASPSSLGTGRMVRLADITHAVTLAGKAFNINTSINFGAANNYHNGPQEGIFSKNNPDCFRDTHYLNFSMSKARAALLVLYRNVLQKGAKMVSIDFCRYPHCVKSPEDANSFMRELRALANEFSTAENHIKILVRFPVPGCKGVEAVKSKFRPETWIKEKLVDYIVPSDFGGNMPYYDVTPFVAMVKGTNVKCLPCLDGLNGGPQFTGEVLRRANDFYDKGADGIYIYQADAHIVGSMTSIMMVHHDVIRTLGNSQLVKNAVIKENQYLEKYSADAYWYFPTPYQGYRARFWIEGVNPKSVDMYINDKLITQATAYPYMLGKQGYENNYNFLGKDIKAKIVLIFKDYQWSRDFIIPQVLRSIAY